MEPQSTRFDPAHKIIALCGGAPKVAEITNRSPSRVYRWTYSKDREGTGGHIPPEQARLILEWAEEQGRDDITPDLFFAKPSPANQGGA